jgi:hypothetical protein
MRAIQMTPAPCPQDDRKPNWMAHTPVGHDSFDCGIYRVKTRA